MNCQVVNDHDLQQRASSAAIAMGLCRRGSFPTASISAWACKCSAKWDQYSNIWILQNWDFFSLFYVNVRFSGSLLLFSSNPCFAFAFKHREKRIWKHSWMSALCWEAHRAVQHSSFVLRLLSTLLPSQAGTGQPWVSVTTISCHPGKMI